MSNCQDIQEMMVEALYNELANEQKAEFDAHLRSCSDCARQYQQMAETLKVISQTETAETNEAFWASYSERLSERLESEYDTPLRTRCPFRLPHLAFRVGAIAALLMVGIFLGKWIWTDEKPNRLVSDAKISPQDQTDAEAILIDDRVQAYLQKSQVLLLALANFDPKTDDTVTLNLPIQKRISESLVQEASYLKTVLDDPAQIRLRKLVADLEVILLQIANLENEHDLEAVEMVQKGVDKQGVLFRIDLSKITTERPKPANRNRT